MEDVQVKCLNNKNENINSKTIVFRCITLEHLGFGHFNRCLTLAKELKKYNLKSHFLITKNEKVIKKLKSNEFLYTILPFNTNIHNESKKISSFMLDNRFSILILDMREFGEKITRELQEFSFKIIMIDDAWTKKAYADIIFNVTNISKYHIYKKINKNCKIYTGGKYFIMETYFHKNQKNIKTIKPKKTYNIIISIGGSDPNNVTYLILKSIIGLSNIRIKIILGPYYKKMKEISKLIKNHPYNQIIISPSKIGYEFKKADIVFSNAGNTLFELASQNIPTISICADEHQIPYSKKFNSKGFGIHLGLWKKIKPKKIQNSLITTLNDAKLRKKISKSGSRIIDGKGVQRIAKKIVWVQKHG